MDVRLRCGATAVVDEHLFDVLLTAFVSGKRVQTRVCDQAWQLLGEPNRQHVASVVDQTIIGLHRLVTSASSGMCVDHIDGDVKNNCIANLRVCTNQQNLRNMRSKGGSSKYKGVSRAGAKFVARIMVNGKDVQRKTLTSEIEAALQYDAWAVHQFG
jgi:hypothetical protein